MLQEALQKSLYTLADHLSPFQSMMAGITGVIPVIDQDDVLWLLSPATIQSAYNTDVQKWYCLTSEDPFLPHGDVVLGIMLMLQHDTDDFYDQALEMKDWPGITLKLYEAAYRIMFQGDEVRPEDRFPNDQCENCTWNGPLTEHCDYHRGVLHGIYTGIEVGYYLYAPSTDKNFNKQLTQYLDVINGGSHEVKKFANDPKMLKIMVETLHDTEAEQQKQAEWTYENMRLIRQLKKLGVDYQFKDLEDVTDDEVVVNNPY